MREKRGFDYRGNPGAREPLMPPASAQRARISRRTPLPPMLVPRVQCPGATDAARERAQARATTTD